MQANVCSIADGEGLCYELDNTLSGNTADAHRLLAWAKELGKEDALLEAMYSGYFEKSKPLFSHNDLLAIVEEAGPVSYTHLRAHETDQYLVCRLLLEKNFF